MGVELTSGGADYKLPTITAAVIRDDRKPVLVGSAGLSGKPRITVFSASGAHIQTIQVSPSLSLRDGTLSPATANLSPSPVAQWDSPARITKLGWTSTETLVVLLQDGTYRLYPLSTATPPPYTQHSLGPDAADAGVVDAHIFEEGMVVLLGSLQFIEVKGWEREGAVGGRVTGLANAGLEDRPSCWCVIRPEVSSSRGVEVVICTGKTVLRLDEIECVDQVSASNRPYARLDVRS